MNLDLLTLWRRLLAPAAAAGQSGYLDKVSAAELWQKIESFPIDKPGAPYPFSKRLADEQDWDDEFTALAILEYKKFMFLAVAAGHDVTPSVVIDEVWHTHLIFTESYWIGLCKNILKKPIHHNPGSGEVSERPEFESIYAKTLAAYRHFFPPPPYDIWGPECARFVKAKGRKSK